MHKTRLSALLAVFFISVFSLRTVFSVIYAGKGAITPNMVIITHCLLYVLNMRKELEGIDNAIIHQYNRKIKSFGRKIHANFGC